MKLTDFIVSEAIITEIQSVEKEAVIREMVCTTCTPSLKKIPITRASG